MPDDIQKLRYVRYTIPGLCGYCLHGDFEGPTALDGWGTCTRHDARIHVTGSCSHFKVDPKRLALTGLGAHQEFFHAEPRAPHGS